MSNQLTQMSPLILYCLKRDFGGPIDIYQLLSSEADVLTGKRVVKVRKYHIHRAVVLPERMSRSEIMLRTSLHNKAFQNLHDEGSREFIIERRDARALWLLTPDDWIVYNHRKYQISIVENFEVDSGWVVTGKEDMGAPVDEVTEETVQSTLAITDEAT